MIKLLGTPVVENCTNTGTKFVRVSLWADTEAEVAGVTTGADIEGLTAKDILTMGSTCLTATEGSFGRLGSDGVWNF